MKIGIIADTNLWSGGGLGDWIRTLPTYLSSRHEFLVLTANRGLQVERDFEIPQTATAASFDTLSSTTVPKVRDWYKLRQLYEVCDVIYYPYNANLLNHINLILQSLCMKAVIVGYHTPFSTKSLYKPNRLFRAHHVLNDIDRGILEGRRFRCIFKIPNGVDCSLYRPGNKSDKFSILFLGRLESSKGANLLPLLLHRLNKEIADYRLMIAGFGSLTILTRALSEDPHVEWFGYVSGETKRNIISSSHVLLSLSPRETFMLSGIEAMASGTPVIAIDAAGPREYVQNEKNGYLVSNMEELLNKIRCMFLCWKFDRGYWEFARNSRTTALNFDWKVVSPKLETMFLAVSKM